MMMKMMKGGLPKGRGYGDSCLMEADAGAGAGTGTDCHRDGLPDADYEARGQARCCGSLDGFR